MYEEHFGLSARPFGETVAPSSYVALASRDSALRRIRYGIEHGLGPVALFGPPGAGKSLIARLAASELGMRTVHLAFPPLPAAEIIALIAEELLGSPLGGRGSAGSLVLRLRDHLAAEATAGRRTLLVVDDAHLIRDPETFESLRLLLNFATNGPPDLTFLLVGTGELMVRIPDSLADRLTARCLLGPLHEDESAAYVHGRLVASGAGKPLFDDEAVRSLHRSADGLPRRLNRLADMALLIAYAEGRPLAGPREVALAAREFQLDVVAA
ncbi:ExeA family protein [Aquisphaera insulae]|uniref:ExeA family protein n=1 Tax=Aquisphaera insulae TaxID=2712864 RepID=UPI0013EA67F4|nr:AAA family ATPase [Aquisphaera insulae]